MGNPDMTTERGDIATRFKPGNKAAVGRKDPNKIVLTDEQVAQVEALASVLNIDQISDYFGFNRDTFFAIRKRDPRVDRAYSLGRAKAVRDVADGLLQAALKGDTASRIFYLKAQANWSEKQTVEHTGPNGGPIQTETTLDVSKLSTAALEEVLAATRAKPETDAG
jgi:hypothetical protein